MAVSFKVPSSPAKSIFTIDEFLGVDLTNSPANIQDNRSPNAPNMTRLVPGKVRKRMGYEKEIIFGTRNNVNYAKGTSCEEQAFIITEDDVNTWVKIYDLLERLYTDGSAFSVYYEFDYKSEHNFIFMKSSYEIPASDEWAHISITSSSTVINYIGIKSEQEQTVYIKNFSVMYAKTGSYKWSPCPKKIYVANADNEVYGFHKFITNSENGNIMTNKNRALNTGTAKTLSFATTDYDDRVLYYLAEDIKPGRFVRLKFDYDYTVTQQGDYCPSVHIGQKNIMDFNETGTALGNHTGTYISNPVEIDQASGFTYDNVAILSHYVMDITISNLSVLYDMTGDYTWTAAPEDSTRMYYPDELYDYGTTNYSTKTYHSDTKTAVAAEQLFFYSGDLQTNSGLKGYSRISFTISGNYENNNVTKTEIFIRYYDAHDSAPHYVKLAEIPTSQTIEGYYDFLLSPPHTYQEPMGANWSLNNYISAIAVNAYTSGANTFELTLSDIKIVSATQKSDLYESSYVKLYHVGDKIYAYRSSTDEYTVAATGVNTIRSMSWQFGTRLFLIDGKNSYLYNYSDNTLNRIGQSNAYIPLVTIAKAPNAGGTSYEPLNLLQPGFYEQFYCDDTTTKNFQLSFNRLDNSSSVRAWVLNASGNWVEKVNGTDFTVTASTGLVKFATAPVTVVPSTGEDNIRILAYRTVSGYADRIRRCTFGTLFGVNGASDRLFLSGNPDMPNYDWYSEKDDPTYFPDTGYSNLGLEISAIVGYSLVNNYLATHKDANEPSQSVFIREGDLIKRTVTTSVGTEVEISEPAFKLINTLQGAPALSPYTFGYVETEPLFLTKSGIFALTTQDITGDKYGQNRSFYLNGALTGERYLQNAYACVHDNMYYLAVNNKMYLIDGLQATRTDRSDPYSTRQYVGFMWNNIPATIVFSDEGSLYFGTADGKICRFYNDVDSLDSYNDDGYPIDAWWETPDLDGKLFYKNKTFRYFASRLMAALATSVKMWAMKTGSWTLIKEDDATGRYFDFGNVNFEKFSFSTDQTEKVVHAKIKVKKVDKARFKLENDALNEPFGIFNIALEYVESGNYKG